MTPSKATVSLRSNARTPLLRTFPLILPLVPPLPTCSEPALIVVPPVTIAAGQDCGPGPNLHDAACAADCPGKRDRVTPIKG